MLGPRDALREFLLALRGAYDLFGLVVIGSLIWFLLSLPLVTAPIGAALLYSAMNRAVHHEDVTARDLLRGTLRFIWRSYGATAVFLVSGVILVVDLHVVLSSRIEWVRYAAGIWVWALVFLFLMYIYSFGIMVEQDARLRDVFARAALLVLDNPGYSITAGIFALPLAALSVFPQAGMALLSMAAAVPTVRGVMSVLLPVSIMFGGGLSALYMTRVTVRALRKYGAARLGEHESPPEDGEDAVGPEEERQGQYPQGFAG